MNNLESALQHCQETARRGYQIAKDNQNELSKAINDVSKSLSKYLKTHENGKVRTNEIVEQLKKQLVSVVKELEQLQTSIEHDLEEKRLKLDQFSITLFGRTMAGKSTLMEILINGNGDSIGKGTQRTTRDVQSYNWNGLEVTDVPGIAAFEGADDEELAFKSATQADLVIFLITDDAPQPLEAECLAKVLKLGKPILGICNIKTAIDDEDDLFLFLRKPERSFDRTRVEQLINQFHSFVDKRTSGKRIPFKVTHLRARFLADQQAYIKDRKKLLLASRFEAVEKRIIREVTGRGSFLRMKNFIDGAVGPMFELTNNLLEFSAQNSASGHVLIDKHHQFQNWAQSFKEDGHERINTLVLKLMAKLRDEVSNFAEDNYKNEKAGKMWNAHVKSSGINEEIKKFQNRIQEDCKKKLIEIARELEKELSFVSKVTGERNIKMDSIFDTKKLWNWVTTGLSGGLGIAALFLASNPIGWGAVAVGIGGWLLSYFFDDYEKKAGQARKKLSEKLHKNIDEMECKLREQLNNWFEQELLKKQVDVLLNDFGIMTSGLLDLADAQRQLAWKLNDRQKALGLYLIKEALVFLAVNGMKYDIIDVAREPGHGIMLLIILETVFPENIKKDIESLMGETIWFVIDTNNQRTILSQAIGRGCEKDKISIERKLKVAHVPLDELDALTLTRVKLAQQLTGIHIMRCKE
ncbi:GTPase domain-containing protein [Candidatus Parabeggiatoa sp. HSG14]|uniref:GTPase domain-containing protein n=1 Tax=Candidatus Parabeggiatoa sp. HSG14 TaxID=3055593 RepID=UPI0025A6EC44|nr:GTPase domain-containing protein [Thiotrichales bacterium HSG14]